MFSYKYYFLILLSITLFVSCDRPECTSNNPIFNNNAPESNAYKSELKNHIEHIGADNLRYWLKAYKEKDGLEYLLVNVQNDSVCAIMQLKVNAWDKKINHIREKKGLGRRGAELVDLKFLIITEPNSIDFVYQNLDRIID